MVSLDTGERGSNKVSALVGELSNKFQPSEAAGETPRRETGPVCTVLCMQCYSTFTFTGFLMCIAGVAAACEAPRFREERQLPVLR